MTRHAATGPDRREHPRVPVVEGLVEPITLAYAPEKPAKGAKAKNAAEGEPAILTNLSAGGMSLITFVAPPHAHVIVMELSLLGLDRVPIEAKVVRVHTKGETYNVGLKFTKISKKDQRRIHDMATDHLDCETRISLGLPEACVPTCRFNGLCQKPQKAPHWPPKV